MKLQNVGRTVFTIMALSLASLSVGCAVEGGELDESEEMTEESVSVGEAEQAYSICLEPYWTTTYSEVYDCRADPATSVNELHRLTYQTVSKYCRCPCGPDRLESSTTTLVGDYNTHQTATCPQ